VKESSPRPTSLRFFRLFWDTLVTELGPETLRLVLEKANPPVEFDDPDTISRYTPVSAAEKYARIQQAIRSYYGRGARGELTRIGRLIWGRQLETASYVAKAQAQLVRNLPPSLRIKPSLDLLASFLRERPDGVTVHSLDLDLLLVDHSSSVTIGQTEVHPICFVTLGLIQEALYWAFGREFDVEERCCRAAGAAQCEFKITLAAQLAASVHSR
jgi:predicted hydrocarbon binding protein